MGLVSFSRWINPFLRTTCQQLAFALPRQLSRQLSRNSRRRLMRAQSFMIRPDVVHELLYQLNRTGNIAKFKAFDGVTLVAVFCVVYYV